MNVNEYAGEYEIYCQKNDSEYLERLREERSDMEEKISKYEELVSDIEATISEVGTYGYKLKIIKALIEDFKGEIKC